VEGPLANSNSPALNSGTVQLARYDFARASR
jgi:hypothetical protein